MGAPGSESITFNCISCGRKLSARQALAGKQVKCPCGRQQAVPGGKPEPPVLMAKLVQPPKSKPSQVAPRAKTVVGDNDKLMLCPDCKQLISKRAATCPNCGAPTGVVEEQPHNTGLKDPSLWDLPLPEPQNFTHPVASSYGKSTQENKEESESGNIVVVWLAVGGVFWLICRVISHVMGW